MIEEWKKIPPLKRKHPLPFEKLQFRSDSSIRDDDGIIFAAMTSMKTLFWDRVRVFNVTFKNISVLSWRFVLLVEETGIPGENHLDYTSPWTGFELTTLVLVGTDCTGNCKSNYHMTAARRYWQFVRWCDGSILNHIFSC